MAMINYEILLFLALGPTACVLCGTFLNFKDLAHSAKEELHRHKELQGMYLM
jgi:hypothetical protein